MSAIDMGIAVLLLWLLWTGYRRGLVSMLVWIGLSALTPWVSSLLAPSMLEWIKTNPDLPLPTFLVQPAALAASVTGAGALLGMGAWLISGQLRGIIGISPGLLRIDRISGSVATVGSGVLTLALISLTAMQVGGTNFPQTLRRTMWFSTVVPQFAPFAPQAAALAQLLPGQRSTQALTAMPGGISGAGGFPASGGLPLAAVPVPQAVTAAPQSSGIVQTLTGLFSSLLDSGSSTSSAAAAPPVTAGGLAPDEAAEAAMLALVNKDRQGAGLPAMTSDPRLREAARKHAADMITRRYYSSTNPDGQAPSDRLEHAGVTFKQSAENLIIGGDAPAAHASLMGSPDHRAVILNGGLARAGIGAFAVPGVGIVFVQDFAD